MKKCFILQLVEREGKTPKLRRKDPDLKKLIKSDLVYLEESPDYCERNDEYIHDIPKLKIQAVLINLFLISFY